MKTGWPYGPGTSDTGGRPDEQLPGQAAAQPHPPLEAPAAPAKRLPIRGKRLPREQAGTDQPRPAPFGAEPAASKSCWLCGIRSPADQMMADGGSACYDLRWYCRDTRACTERWTSRPARVAALRQAIAEKRRARGKEATDADIARPAAGLGVPF
jgi:hypothetical protein